MLIVKPNILVTGINGLVGRGLAAALQGSDCLVKGTKKEDRRRETEERFSDFCDR